MARPQLPRLSQPHNSFCACSGYGLTFYNSACPISALDCRRMRRTSLGGQYPRNESQLWQRVASDGRRSRSASSSRLGLACSYRASRLPSRRLRIMNSGSTRTGPRAMCATPSVTLRSTWERHMSVAAVSQVQYSVILSSVLSSALRRSRLRPVYMTIFTYYPRPEGFKTNLMHSLEL